MKEIIVSFVLPCLNEEKVIAIALKNCKDAFKKNNISGQILILDSGTDHSSQIAEKMGADVLKVKKKGLGAAYKASIPYIKGKYVLMGDVDGTYDYKEMTKFVKQLDKGYEFVMGTRIKGWIEKDSMPKLHQFFGTPLTTWILNRLFRLNFSDIHSGFRALTLDAFIRMDLKSDSWEYASEMVVKAGLLKLNSTEVPIHFYKDVEGRVSHHKRQGWFSPWYAGWINLKIMFLYAPNFIFVIPGLFGIISGLVINITSLLNLFPILKFHFALLGLILTVIGYMIIQFGLLSKLFSDLNKYYTDKFTVFFREYFTYSKGMISGSVLIVIGIIINLFLLYTWIGNHFALNTISLYSVTGLTLIVLGFQTVFFSLLYEVFRVSKI